MRILHITAQYPGKTGSGTYLQAMIKEADKEGYSQGLLGAIQDDMHYENEKLDYIEMVKFNTEKIPFPIMGMSDKMPYKSSIYKDMNLDDLSKWEAEFTQKLQTAIRNFSPDLILSHHLWLGTSIAAKLSGDIPVFGICHGTDVRQFLKVPWLGDRTREGIKNLQGIFSLTEEQKKVIEKLYKIPAKKIHVAGGGYNEEIFYPGKKELTTDKIKIVYAGKLSYAKGLLPLLHVYKELSSTENLQLIMAGSGDGEERDEIIRVGNLLGVIFTGALSQRELADIFRESHIFVLPSYYEGLPLVTMEALACGLRIVTTDIAGLRGYMGDKISSSGLVEFVELPRMINVDRPVEEDYKEFVHQLKKTLYKQINNVKIGYNSVAPFKREIEKLSWQGVFERIRNSF